MEVHHHPDLHHKPKPWKEYFLEFIMIFLAVTLGFFAEGIREHLSDRTKEKEYIRSIVSNLNDDIAELKIVISQNKYLAEGFDSLKDDFHQYLDRGVVKKYDSPLAKSADSISRAGIDYLGKIYDHCARYLTKSYRFATHEATMVQLKNSGGFRLIQADHAADSIATYDLVNLSTSYEDKIYSDQFSGIYDLWSHVFDLSYVGHRQDTLPRSAVIAEHGEMRYFYNKVMQLRETIAEYVNTSLLLQLAYAERLIEYLKKVYHIRSD